MERVAFILEQSNERLGCLLNPESLTVRRQAGIQSRRSSGGFLTGKNLRDDPLLATGGGRTEILLDLLFDIGLGGSTIRTEDVRRLTRPLHDLAENQQARSKTGEVPIVRFVWGKTWNLPAVVANVAERFEAFSANGIPRRSWLRMRLFRMEEDAGKGSGSHGASRASPGRIRMRADARERTDSSELRHYSVRGNGAEGGGERLDVLAERTYGHPAYWRLIADFNDLDHPEHVQGGQELSLPPTSILEPNS